MEPSYLAGQVLPVICICRCATFVTRTLYWACIHGACEWVTVKPMNINHLDSHMYHVLYFGVLIWSIVGRVTLNRDIHKYIERVTAYIWNNNDENVIIR
jgi:hypothetical protein